MKTSITVTIETPRGSHEKFDYNFSERQFVLSKVLPAGMVFPFDFGFLPGTLGEDGDPLDVLVISEFNTFTGCTIPCRIIGVMKADQRERDGDRMRNDRFLAVPEISLTYAHLKSVKNLPGTLTSQIETFFTNYNAQAGKVFTLLEYGSAESAWKLITKGRSSVLPEQKLIQLFLPLPKAADGIANYQWLEQLLTKKFGGTSIYRQSPVQGNWLEHGKTVRDELIVFEVMAFSYDETFWKSLKERAEKEFNQKQILIRRMDISLTG